MAEARKKLPKFTTPKGKFLYPKLVEVDYGTDKFKKPEGEYNVKLILQADDPATKEFLAKLQPTYQEALSEGKVHFDALPVAKRKELKKLKEGALYQDVYDKETEEPTGEIIIGFKMKASGTYSKGPKTGQKWHRKPVIFDAKGLRIEKPPAIWSGTIGRVSFSARPYWLPKDGQAGLTLYLEAVQIIDLVTSGGASASQHGFDEEDGYQFEEAPAEDAPLDADDKSIDPEAGNF